jgi:hypothetical protein
MKIRLQNEFHGSMVTIIMNRGKIADMAVIISKRTARRVKHDLCGVSDCQCSGVLGIRGEQPRSVDEKGEPWAAVEALKLPDGRVRITLVPEC